MVFIAAAYMTRPTTNAGEATAQDDAATDAPSPQPTDKVISQIAGFDLIVHHRYHIGAAFSDQDDAVNYLANLSIANDHAAVDRDRQLPTFMSFAGEGSPLCKIADQEPVGSGHPNDIRTYNGPLAPIACDMDDGTRVFVVRFTTGKHRQ